MGCGVYWQQVREVERALGSLRRLGIAESSPAISELMSLRGKLIRQVGFKFPRTISSIMKLAGLSPGTLTLMHDAEEGFLVNAREREGAVPVTRYIPDELAATILKGELTHEAFMELLVPDDYLGE